MILEQNFSKKKRLGNPCDSLIQNLSMKAGQELLNFKSFSADTQVAVCVKKCIWFLLVCTSVL